MYDIFGELSRKMSVCVCDCGKVLHFYYDKSFRQYFSLMNSAQALKNLIFPEELIVWGYPYIYGIKAE